MIRFSMQPTSGLRALVIGLVAIATIASCRLTEPASRFPMAGTYDLTTVLDTFNFEIGAGPLTCGRDGYCTRSSADTTGRLTGRFTIGDATDSAANRHPVVNTVVAGRFCDAKDYTTYTCTHASEVPATIYPTGDMTGPVLASAVPGDVIGTIHGPAEERIDLVGRFYGDSIVGKVHWQLIVFRNPPIYSGTFVARRRR
jgi:hypothetical protein